MIFFINNDEWVKDYIYPINNQTNNLYGKYITYKSIRNEAV